MAYIYVIENDINDKKYIGKTEFSIEKRWKEHCRDYKQNRSEKRPLYNAMSRYGIEHFKIKIIEECSSEEASEKEQYWISFYNSYYNGYNATLGGDGKSFVDYRKILKLFDTTLMSQKEIAEECNCSIDSVKNIVSQYRSEVKWQERFSKKHIPNSLGITGLTVQCVETNQIFHSATAAANWLIEQGKIKSQNYGRNKIPMACRGERKTVGGYQWKFVE